MRQHRCNTSQGKDKNRNFFSIFSQNNVIKALRAFVGDDILLTFLFQNKILFPLQEIEKEVEYQQ